MWRSTYCFGVPHADVQYKIKYVWRSIELLAERHVQIAKIEDLDIEDYADDSFDQTQKSTPKYPLSPVDHREPIWPVRWPVGHFELKILAFL